MTDTQKELLRLYEEITVICDKYDIVYYLAGGTLIGALRHKGFIPWDDDLDIMMSRDNWLRFIEAYKKEKPQNRVLECQELNRNYNNVFGRYIDTETTAIHKNELVGDCGTGYLIDIIPLDPVPDEDTFRRYTEDMLLYSDLINETGLFSYRYGINRERFHEALKRTETEGKDAVLSELEDRMFSYDEDKCDYCVLRWGGVPFMFEKDLYGHSRWGEFEGIKSRIPDRASDYLVRHFGDEWTTIPPHDEQIEHDAIFSLDIDYRTFKEDYMPLVDADAVRKKWLERKKLYFSSMESRRKLAEIKVRSTAELRRLEINRILDKEGANIPSLLSNGDYKALSDIFEDYFRAQFDRDLIGREDYGGMQRFVSPVLIDIPDDVLHAAAITLINTNRVSKAHRLLEIRKQVRGELTPELEGAERKIAQFRRIISDYDAGLIKQAETEAEEMYADNPSMISLEMFLCRVYLETGKADKAIRLIEKCISEYPKEGYFKKYKGDYYLNEKADVGTAKKLYAEAQKTSDNGMVLLEIKETLERING
ncbi:MAG: LicD family protein [Mogibacterium sp.]|nr:LicD family protein [Mogibacterium sp.]